MNDKLRELASEFLFADEEYHSAAGDHPDTKAWHKAAMDALGKAMQVLDVGVVVIGDTAAVFDGSDVYVEKAITL